MIVVTMDQRGSRTRADAVPGLARALEHLPTLRPFQRTAGDEMQAVFDDGRAAMAAVLHAAATGSWNVGVGVGLVRLPLPPETRAGAGEAFEAAREAVEAAKRTQALLALRAPSRAPEASRLEAELALITLCLRRRTPPQVQAAERRERGESQAEIAANLGISQQAVSKRLAAALYDEVAALTVACTQALVALNEGVDPLR